MSIDKVYTDEEMAKEWSIMKKSIEGDGLVLSQALQAAGGPPLTPSDLLVARTNSIALSQLYVLREVREILKTIMEAK